MVSEFIKSRLDLAHNMIDEGRYREAIAILKNLKLRLHESDQETAVTEFENKKDLEFDMSVKEIQQGTYRDNE